MEEKKFIKLKKEEFGIKEYIKRQLGKGKISNLDIEYTPVGEKIIISTSKPGLVIGRKGENIEQLTKVLKRRFKLENPHIEISEIENPLFDAQGVADEIALALERMGNLKFKVISYRKLQEIMKAGAFGCELRLTGKLPSERAKSWRFADGYLKKAGDSAKEVNRAQATGLTKTGIIGVKVAIMPPGARIYDKIDVDDEMLGKLVDVLDEIEEKPKNSGKKNDVDTDKSPKKNLNKSDNSNEVVKEKKTDEEVKEDDLQTVEEATIETSGGDRVIPEIEGDAIAIEEKIEEGVSEEDEKVIKELEDDEKKNRKLVSSGDENINKDELVKDDKE
jgi:small subunit ribosomal protein S3